MTSKPLTLFTWGYDGWGNWTDKLVEAVDAVEKSRGWGPPVFVDIRASRKVRAEGFREKAFEKRFGPDRYRWIQGLGNKAIITHEKYGKFVDVAQATNLFDLSLELQVKNRRAIYFCSCVSPTDGCHRHWVAPHLFKEAERRQQPVTVVEWPGFESEPGEVRKVRIGPGIISQLNSKRRTSVPLGTETPTPDWLGLPWYTPVDLVDDKSGETVGAMLTGPAQHRAGGWQLPACAGAEPVEVGLQAQAEEREDLIVLPRSWPASKPAQKPFVWKAG